MDAIALLEQDRARPRPIDPAAGRYFGDPDAEAVRRFRGRDRRFI